MKNKINLIFILICVISIFIRFWQLNHFPVGLNWDEISHGYNAYSLIKTNHDQWSKSWPLFNFRAYGDYPTVLNMYLSIPFIYFFGLNEWSIRIVSALCGFGLVVVSYFLGKEIFKNKKYSYLLMFLTSISPWTFFPSRAVFQSTVAQFFLSLGILLLLKAKDKIKYLPLGTIFISLSTYAYHNTKIIVPIIIFAYLLIFYRDLKKPLIKNKKISLLSIFILTVLIVPQTINSFNKDAQARSRWVFAINPATINQIEVSRNNYQGSPFIAKLKYNKLTTFTAIVIKNFVGFINPQILFFNSTQNYQFNIPQTGVLFPICLPFFYIGIISLVIKLIHKNKTSFFLFSWFLVGLIPAIITIGDFPIIRAMTILPLPLIFITQGINTTISTFNNQKTKIIILTSFILVLTIESIFYFRNYFTIYAQNYSQSWQYGYKQVVDYIKENYQNYNQIIVTKKYGEAHEFILFYWPWNPESYQKDPNINWDFHADWYWVNAFDKFKFINDWEIKDQTKNINQKTLLITSPDNYNKESSHLLKTIYFLDNQPAFDILNLYDQKP